MLITSNEYNTANQLVATRSYAVPVTSSPSPLTFTLICYNSLGERNLTVEDMNRNNQIDWSDTDRIVSNDTRYVSLNGDWWRETSTWQTRQNGSPALTRVGLTRTRLTGLANNGDERLANNGEYPPTAQRSPEGAATRGAASSPLVQKRSVLISETHSLDPLSNETVSCSYLDRATHTTTQTNTTPASTLPAETVVRCGLTVSTRTPTDVTTIYAYDALGRRVTTRNAEGTERHVYDDNWQVVADLDEDGNVVRSYVWGEGIDRILAVKIGSKTYTALTDVQGTVWGYADEAGDVVARWTYDAWGNVLSEEIAGGAAELRAVRYRFQGREHSAVTGLTNFRMRWYDAVTGRWLSKDPIGLSGGMNLYAFCGGDPVNSVDSIGLCPDDEKQKIKELRDGMFGDSWLIEMLAGIDMHGAGGAMDYAATQPGHVWKFPGPKTRKPNEMGNYMAGYAAGYSSHPLFLYVGVRMSVLGLGVCCLGQWDLPRVGRIVEVCQILMLVLLMV